MSIGYQRGIDCCRETFPEIEWLQLRNLFLVLDIRAYYRKTRNARGQRNVAKVRQYRSASAGQFELWHRDRLDTVSRPCRIWWLDSCIWHGYPIWSFHYRRALGLCVVDWFSRIRGWGALRLQCLCVWNGKRNDVSFFLFQSILVLVDITENVDECLYSS